MTFPRIASASLAAVLLAGTLGAASSAEAAPWRNRDQLRLFNANQCVWQGRTKRVLAQRSIRIVRNQGYQRVYNVDCTHRLFKVQGRARVLRNGRTIWRHWTRWVNPRNGRMLAYNPYRSYGFWRR